jgi:hypothetical protein
MHSSNTIVVRQLLKHLRWLVGLLLGRRLLLLLRRAATRRDRA